MRTLAAKVIGCIALGVALHASKGIAQAPAAAAQPAAPAPSSVPAEPAAPGPAPVAEHGPAQPSAAAQPPAAAAGAEHDATELSKKTQNPVADLVSLPFQFNFNNGGALRDQTQMVLNFQPV